MPALSFQEEWINKLLAGTKQQTTRPRTDRIKVGDICNIYNQQRRRIVAKAVRQMTGAGTTAMADRVCSCTTFTKYGYRYPAECPVVAGSQYGDIPSYYAHFLGKVRIMEVYNILPWEMSGEELEAWAWADGFKGFHPTYKIFTKGISEDDGANMWFQRRYGDDWMRQWWTVIRWHGWVERYFEPEM